MPAADLKEAAATAYDNMFGVWIGNTLELEFREFNDEVTAAFPSDAGDNSVAERTVSNWIVIAREVQNDLGQNPIAISLEQFNRAVQVVYRICWAGFIADADGRITAGQATAILNSYNLHFP